MRTFDVTSDGKQIVFDRLRENSQVCLLYTSTATGAAFVPGSSIEWNGKKLATTYAVSYTHLDVYKRQGSHLRGRQPGADADVDLTEFGDAQRPRFHPHRYGSGLCAWFQY